MQVQRDRLRRVFPRRREIPNTAELSARPVSQASRRTRRDSPTDNASCSLLQWLRSTAVARRMRRQLLNRFARDSPCSRPTHPRSVQAPLPATTTPRTLTAEGSSPACASPTESADFSTSAVQGESASRNATARPTSSPGVPLDREMVTGWVVAHAPRTRRRPSGRTERIGRASAEARRESISRAARRSAA